MNIQKTLRSFLAATVLAALLSYSSAFAAVKTQTVEYKDGNTVLEGYLAYDDAKTGKVPGVVVFHDWMGLGDYVKHRAEQLAAMGYVAFAGDIYGKGSRPKDQKEAAEFAGKYKGDRTLFRSRVKAALDTLRQQKNVDSARLDAMGYCFGGTGALELGRSGAELRGIMGFHAGLDSPTPADARNIRGRVLVMQGGDDPFVPQEQVTAFEDEMRKGKVDWQLIQYGGAVHSFTLPTAGNDPSKGQAYNEKADKRSFEEMKRFLNETLGAK